MIESKLTELLEHAADHTTVGPPPMDALRAGAVRRRRRRTAAWSATTAVAVVAAIGGTTLLVTQRQGDPVPPAASNSPGMVPGGTRLVGLGHVAMAVPKGWGTNQARCGTPQKDTVLIDTGPVLLYCLHARPAGVDSVEVLRGKPNLDFHVDETTDVDGVPAELQRTTCDEGPINRVTVCSGTVFIPSLDVSFRAESSTNAAEVDRILARIVLVPDRVGVPGYRTVDEDGHQLLAADYAAALEQAGLKPKIQTRKSPGYPAGTIFTASPGPGTMLTPGATVTVTVAG